MMAVALARKHGVHRTARTLPIDHVGLRKRLDRMAENRAVARPQFVEILLHRRRPAAARVDERIGRLASIVASSAAIPH